MADILQDNNREATSKSAPPGEIWTMFVEHLSSKSQLSNTGVKTLLVEDFFTSNMMQPIKIETPEKMKFMPVLPTINPYAVTKIISMPSLNAKTQPRFEHIPNFDAYDANKSLQNVKNDVNLEVTAAELDCFLGAFLILLTIIGLSGNIISFSYFWKRRKKTIHDFLYMLISASDVLTSMASFPVIVSLLSLRAPMLFGIDFICHFWPIAFYLLIRVSMFLIIIVTVTRALVILQPLTGNRACVHPNKVMMGMIAYCLILLTTDLVFVLSGNAGVGKRIKFIKEASFCEILSFKKFDTGGSRLNPDWRTSLYLALLHLEILLPCVIVFVSFFVSTISLLRRKTMKSEDEKNFRRISVTIAIFTALFLICYLPCFMLQMVYFIYLFNVKVAFLRPRSAFLQYGHLVIQFVLPLLNSAANPCLYFARMPRFRKWLKNWYIKPKLNSTTRNIEPKEVNLADLKVNDIVEGSEEDDQTRRSEQTQLLRSV